MPPTKKKPVVLIADDNAVVRVIVSRMVEALGYDSVTATDGDNCIAILGSRPVDLLLLDIHMPKKNGLEVLSYIRDHNYTLPVIMSSGSSDLEQAVESLKLGAYQYLLKPIDPERLGTTIKNALREQDLRQQVMLLTAAMAQSPLTVVITGPDGTIDYVNPAFTVSSGYSDEEVRGKKMKLISSGKHSQNFYKQLWETISSGKSWDGEFINRRKNGDLYWESATISPITDRVGQIAHYIAIKQDITQQKKEQEALAESEMRFQELAELLPQPVFECDTRGIITYTNRLGYELFGYTKEDLEAGVSSLELFMEEERSRVAYTIECRLKDIPFERHEYTGKKKDGTGFPILIYSAKIVRNGCPVGVRGIVLDITERRKIEEELLRLNHTLEHRVEERTRELENTHRQMILRDKLASIGQLAAGLAHELNNPINFVRINFSALQEDIDDLQSILAGYREIIRKYEAGEALNGALHDLHQKESDLGIDTLLEDIPKIFSESKSGFDRIKTIIESMRNFSFRHHENEKVLFDINKGIRDTLIIARNEYRYIAEVKKDLSKLPLIPCNPEQINQVFLNLIINSAHAIASQQRTESGMISIHTWHDDDHVFCSIADDGPGISNEAMLHIFEPFFTTKSPGKGTGLGLSISYDIIVQKHEGKLSVHAPSEGGTVFTIELPLRQLANTDKHD
ncbi:MAG: PAS domain S-box protein [Chlorobiaceae bacterium]|nr:PAS domain S-box protein [Chlorobiaceae bacterium]NTW74075.1 PAS domain S-box protein [Chlorobiaceae bacterium]